MKGIFWMVSSLQIPRKVFSGWFVLYKYHERYFQDGLFSTNTTKGIFWMVCSLQIPRKVFSGWFVLYKYHERYFLDGLFSTNTTLNLKSELLTRYVQFPNK